MHFSFLMTLLLPMAGCNSDKATDSDPSVSTDTDTETGPAMPALYAVAGSAGAVAWADASELDVVLERDDGDGWLTVAEGEPPWIDEGAPEGSQYRLRHASEDATSDPITPEPLTLTLGVDGPPALYSGEVFDADVAVSAVSESPPMDAALVLSWETPEATWFFDGDCDGSCWSEAPAIAAGLTLGDDASVLLSALRLPDAPSVQGSLVAALVVDLGDGELRFIEQHDATLVHVDRTLAWGDLHAHSNLSHDGCEEPDDNCRDTVDLSPGRDFFQVAVNRGLDFVALTDHAEWLLYYPSGRQTGEAFPVWEQQLALVQEAEAAGEIIPLLGYEWTYFGQQEPSETGHFLGGHKTVLLSETEVCTRWRLAARDDIPYSKGVGGALFVAGNPFKATTPRALYTALEDAAAVCDDGVQAISFMHHTASEWPQPVDFSLESNFPDPAYEMLIELYSEHGSSECYDIESADCGWHLKSNSRYWPQGSVQAALMAGYQLGFTAGTDSHDARPGPEDDPSCTANFTDTDGDGTLDSAQCHDWRGGVTGVLVEGDLDRVAIWQGLRTRGTLASSGPRYPLRAFLVGQSGEVVLPGGLVPADELPARLIASVEGLEDIADAEVLSVSLIAADGSPLLTTNGPLLEDTLDLAAGESAYVRVVLTVEGEEHRIWASPFFAEAVQ